MPPYNNTQTDTQKPLRPLKTFKDDMVENLQQSNGSIKTVLHAEERRRRNIEQGTYNSDTSSTPKRKIILWGSVLVGTGILFVALAFILLSEQGRAILFRTNSVPKASLISSESSFSLPFHTNRELLLADLVTRRRNTTLALGKIEEVLITGPNATIQTILPTIAPNVPQPFVRLLLPQYFIGFVQTGYRDAFLIMETDSFHTSFNGLLEWEPMILSDLGLLLTRLDSPAFKEITKEGPPVTQSFKDEIIENRDLRVLRDLSGQIALLYGIVDQKTIIIAGSESSFKEALTRLLTRRAIR